MFTMVIYTINWFMGVILYTGLQCVPGYVKVKIIFIKVLIRMSAFDPEVKVTRIFQ